MRSPLGRGDGAVLIGRRGKPRIGFWLVSYNASSLAEQTSTASCPRCVASRSCSLRRQRRRCSRMRSKPWRALGKAVAPALLGVSCQAASRHRRRTRRTSARSPRSPLLVLVFKDKLIVDAFADPKVEGATLSCRILAARGRARPEGLFATVEGGPDVSDAIERRRRARATAGRRLESGLACSRAARSKVISTRARGQGRRQRAKSLVFGYRASAVKRHC